MVIPFDPDRTASENVAAMHAAGLEVIRSGSAQPASTRGSQLSTNPPLGSAVPQGSIIQVHVSEDTGPGSAALVRVPLVVGLPDVEAAAALEAAGFRHGVATDSAEPGGDVIAQRPKANSLVPIGLPISLRLD